MTTTPSTIPSPPPGLSPAQQWAWTMQMLQQSIANAAAGSQSNMLPSPIGVPEQVWDPATKTWVDWTAHVPWGTMPSSGAGAGSGGYTGYHNVPPTFFSGDEIAPGSRSATEIADLQRALVAAGLLKAGQFQLGFWDQASIQAYTQVLFYANMAGLSSATQALSQITWNHNANPPTAGPLQTSVTNPDDLKLAFRKAIIDTLGQGWSEDKLNAMVGAYQQTERNYQIASQTAQAQGNAVSLTAPASPDAYATMQAEQQDPSGAKAHDYLTYYNAFQDAIGKWQG